MLNFNIEKYLKENSDLDQKFNDILDNKYEINTKSINTSLENIFIKKSEFYLDDKLYSMTKRNSVASIIFFGDSRDNIVLSYNIQENKFNELKEIIVSDFIFKDYSSISNFKNNIFIITGGCKYSNYKNTASNSVFLVTIDEDNVVSFAEISSLNMERFSHGSCLLVNKIYVFGTNIFILT